MRRRTVASAFVAVLVSVAPLAGAAAPLSDALKAKRPKGGEWFGLYLLGKKVGHAYVDLALVPGQPDKAKATNEFVFETKVDTRVSRRVVRDVRIYESKPNGRLLSFVIEQHGDGGDQIIEGTNTPSGLHIIRKRPGAPNDVRTLPPSSETIEAADQARVALWRGGKVESRYTDGTDLEAYRVTSEVMPDAERVLGGVKTKVKRVSTLSEKENVPTINVFTRQGETVEIQMGETLRAVAEPKEVAERLDKVEVFALTRVVLPEKLDESRRMIPGQLKLTVTGLPERFCKNSARQKFRQLGKGRTEITITARFPDKESRLSRPVKDPTGGQYLEPTLTVESDDAQIAALAKKIVGGEKDAYAAAKAITFWVYQHMQRDYGASADRATDVLRRMKGDCTEHALLATALMRAAGIPARRVDGVVYVMNEDGVPALYWHEWVQAYVGEWTDLDPTFNQAVADATHLALGEEGSAEITPLIGSLKVEKVE
ncbi:MAG: transglutaminase domain-containing protein [Myxococcaceae bacterium]|nr:transglutaminase domain-containing protein [Myxococcaceae bacterium]